MSGEDWENIAQNLLRDTEHAKIVLETCQAPIELESSGDSTPLSPTPDISLWDNPKKKRLLAVVTHFDSVNEDEQACAFIFRLKIRRPSDTATWVVEHVLPIFGDFAIHMAQPRTNTIDLPEANSTSIFDQPHTEFTLTIYPGHDSTIQPIYLLTRDTHRLRALLTEYRRLKELSAANNEPGTYTPFTWTLPYTATSLPTVRISPIPPDLRHIHRPIHTLLSEASAGQPGEDSVDISLIREEWIKHQVHEECYNNSPKFTLKIRLGTFNVNGKLPSQDLSPWVGGRNSARPMIPPLDDVSPLSIGDIGKNLERAHIDDATEEVSIPSSSSTLTTQTLVSAATTKTSYLPTKPQDDPDIIVLGFQELDLSTGALLYSTETTREDAWFAAALAGLGEKADRYRKLVSKQLVGMLLMIIVKEDLVSCFTDIMTTSVGAGILGLMGNKGATAIRVSFAPPSPSEVSASTRPTTLTFVNSHLAAFDEMYDRRNADFHDLSKRLSFDSGIPISQDVDDDFGNPYPPKTIPLTVFQSDALFWLVNLNYRVNLSDSDIRTLLNPKYGNRNISTLLKYDQLKFAIKNSAAFPNFHEHSINFHPSYRFNAGMSADDLGYDMKRKPAWTDRVLCMASPASQIDFVKYSAHPEICTSDHKPVSAECRVSVPIINLEKMESSVQKLWREVLDCENSDEVPRMNVTPATVEFGDVFYERSTTQVLELSNLGKVPCAFRFVPITSEAPVHPPWLRLPTMTGLIQPGEKLTIPITVTVDSKNAYRLNTTGSGRLEDTLILHTMFGKDHFISVRGRYQKTCFATPLERLSRLSGPIRSPASLDLLPVDQALNAPREVMRLVNWLMSHAVDVPDLFVTPGDDSLVFDIRECLDTGNEFEFDISETDKFSICKAFATCLLKFLDSLPHSVIPRSLQARCAQVLNREMAFELLSELPGYTVNVWVSITAFLHYICHQTDGTHSNSQYAEILADIFTPVLLREDPSLSAPISIVGKRRFVLFFIE
ncbi:inositol 1,4,5-trisphosphate 5-phosphatase type II family protein [Abortiporus biennis]